MKSAQLIYKIVHRDAWAKAEEARVFAGAEIDLVDGFIHFSSAAQVSETASKFFAGQSDLLLVAVDTAELAENLKWEPSRGGDLFPHLYGPLDLSQVVFVEEIPQDGAGNHKFSQLPIE
jgi:uncharacterized protein (DUF952 family)